MQFSLKIEILPFSTTSVNLENIYAILNKHRKTKYCTVLLICEIQNSQTLSRREQNGGRRKQGYVGQGTVFPGGANGKEPACQCRRHKKYGFDPWVRKISWRRKWQLTPVFLPGKFHEKRILGGLQSVGSQRVGHDSEQLH